ncbi:hypothetical protein V2O64_07025 [Verrucomicrobiaceae bacterium 227]
MAKVKAKAKRYTAEQKKEILDFIEQQGRGGQTKAVQKFKVTAATIASWKKKAGGGDLPGTTRTGGSKELRALEDLAAILKEIETTEAHLAKLQKGYAKAKAKL